MLFCKQAIKYIATFMIPSLLTGCMVGPDFHRPCAPATCCPCAYTEIPLPCQTASTPKTGSAGKAQKFVCAVDIPRDWWYLFHSPEINCLVCTGIANSPTLVAAQAALMQAQENVKAQIGNSLLPAVDAQVGGLREQFAGSTYGNTIPSSLFDLYNASISVTYTLDVFGGARRQIESLIAQADYQRYQLLATYLTLTSNIVTTAITTASLEEQICATRELIKLEEDQLEVIRKQYTLGGVAYANVLTQLTLVEQTKATLPPLQKSLSNALHSLSVLLGQYTCQTLPKINLEAIILPKDLPISLASCLVRQRPDVLSSEAQLHAASAQIGVATANLFPQFNLSGNYGWASSAPSQLFHPISNVWEFGGQILQPVFHGGALRAQRRAAIDAYNQAGAQYQQTVLQAFQNVADALRALETDARSFRALREAELAARDSFRLTKEQYVLGGVSYLNLLTAQQQYQQTLIKRIQAQATRYADTAALFQALGGGWWSNTSVACQTTCLS